MDNMRSKKNKNFNIMHYVRKVHFHTLRHLKLWFIPHDANNHHPHALRPKALKAYVALLLIVKMATAAFFFIAYPNPAQFAQLTADTMLSLTNSSRIAIGVSTLSTHPRLIQAAEAKAQDMIDQGYFSHTSPDGSRFFTWIQDSGYNYSLAGENLAMDFTSAESAHNALMASASHKENILNGSYVHMGIAVKTGVIDGKNTIVLVEMFGTPYVPPTVVVSEPAPAPTPAPQPTPAPTPVPTPAPTPEPAPTFVTSASVVTQSAHTIEIQQGENTEFSVTLKNTGNTTWQSDYTLRATSLEYKSKIQPVTLYQDVAPGDEITLSYEISGFDEPGTFAIGFVLGDSTSDIESSRFGVELQISQKPPVQFASNAVASAKTATPAQVALATVNPPDHQIKPTQFDNEGLIAAVASSANRFFFGFVVFLVAILILNIVIRMRVQHGHVIVQVAVVLAIAATALLTRLSFLEGLGSTLQIL